LNYSLSTSIYNELIKGKYLNKDIFDIKLENVIPNELYIETEKNYEEYVDFFKKMGLKLEQQNNSFYLERHTDSEEIDKNILKQYVILSIIIRHLQDKRIPITNFKDSKIGISEDIIEDSKKNQYSTDLLKQSDISNTAKSFIYILERKNIVYKNHKSNYVLTNIGEYFLDYIFDIGKNIVEGGNENV